jgi:hypothetical protein
MDIKAYADAAVAGVPLLFVVFGLVSWLKSFKNSAGGQLIDGNWLLLVSMLAGVVLGGGYMVSQTRPPGGDWWVGYVYWFTTVIYGIGLGVVASGFYNEVKRLIAGLADRHG